MGQRVSVCYIRNWRPTCILPLQCARKKNGKLCLVLAHRYVNGYMSMPKFKQEGIESVASLIQEEDEMITIDTKDGFHQGTHVKHQKYLGLQWKNQ